MEPDLSIDDPMSDVGHVFVYGTLKRGECNERVWPCRPVRVEPAWILGALFESDAYPALCEGSDRIEGELWSFTIHEMPAVLDSLDHLEGTTSNAPEDLYHRQVVDVTLVDGQSLKASTYFYNRDPIADGFTPVAPIDGRCRWPSVAIQKRESE
ncbi:MAG: gamma-glutamylcyclotransferase family protein [Planctomycetota bacterium]